jgi:class 3 adenylate cyclase/tetratricopeptide (TPR) repeat protein
MQCPVCSYENRETARFCLSCGQRFSSRCKSCQAELPAAARYCDECGEPVGEAAPPRRVPFPLAYTPKHLAEKILTSRSALEGERKQVTVLFADVKGSMELAEQVDPEEWHKILDRFFQILSDGVHRFEGTINQYTGDGIMALFGAPIAHEDHAQRACYAALRLGEELRRYAAELRAGRGLNFSVRMGLSSGEVIVGKIGDDLRMDYTAQGHTVGLAQRMEQLAEPGRAYLTEHTARLVEGLFRLGDLGMFTVKGVHDPLRVYELMGVGPLRTRMEVSVRRGLMRFVGRQDEMEQLRRAWESAKGGHGQIVAVMGEPGVGKSRLFYEFKVPVQAQGLVLEAFSVSHGKAHAYLPLIDLLKSYFRIGLEDDERRRQEKINGKVLTLDRKLEDALPYLFSLLGATDPTFSLAQMDAQIRRQRTLEAVKRVLVRETLNQPMVVIFEDLHWIDGETQAFLEVLSEAVATARLLLLVNYRPEYRHGWGSKTYYRQLRLDPLGKDEAEELLTALLGAGAVREPPLQPLKRLIIEKTEGNPFFMEEVVQGLWEEGVLSGERGRYRLEKAATELHIPATVQGVLAARIDRLPANEKEFLQILSVIGKEFPLGLLRQVTGHAEGELYHLLSHVQAGEFVYEQPAFPEPEYTFKHALTQEVAYQSVLLEKRKLLHERTAQAIEGLYEYRLDEHYGELAHHYSRTDNVRKAVEYLHLSGQQALERSAYDEAARQLDRGLELLAAQPDTRERAAQELPLRITLGRALTVMKGGTTPEVEGAYKRARDLCRRVGGTSQLFGIVAGLCAIHSQRGERRQAHELAEELLRLAEISQEPGLLVLAHLQMGTSLFWSGEPGAREHLQRSLTRYDPRLHQAPEFMYAGANPKVIALWYSSLLSFAEGYPDQALQRSREAVQLAQELAHPFSLLFALGGMAEIHSYRGEVGLSQQRFEALSTLAEEFGFPFWVMIANLWRAYALADLGREQEAITLLEMGVNAIRAGGALVILPRLLVRLGEVYARAGKAAEGLRVISEGWDLMKANGDFASEAYLHTVKGEVLLAMSEEKEAESCFRQAIEIARRRSQKSEELRAATSLARLWQKQGKKEQARRILAEIYGWFTEGFDTRDLREATALLDELSQGI